MLIRAITGSTVHFLITPVLAINTVGFLLVVFLHLGFGLIYFLAAMNGIDKEIYEAALIDGASFWQHLCSGHRPEHPLRGRVLGGLQLHRGLRPHVLLHSYPHPRRAGLQHLHPGVRDFHQGFSKFKVGYSSAWSVVLFVFCAIISVAQIRLMRRRDE